MSNQHSNPLRKYPRGTIVRVAEAMSTTVQSVRYKVLTGDTLTCKVADTIAASMQNGVDEARKLAQQGMQHNQQ